MNNDPIGDALNMNPMQPLLSTSQRKSLVPTDYEYARGSMITVIEKGNEALSDMLSVAQQSQQPRAYEVVAQLIQSSLEANNKLMDLHRRMKEIKKQERSNSTSITNNSIYVGSTSDLQKLIKEQRKAVDRGDIVDEQ